MLVTAMHLAQRTARLAVLLAWMALLTYWSSQSNLPIDQPLINDHLHGLQHRVAHLLAYALLGILARWAFDGLPRATLFAVALTSAFGASDEWHQQFTPGRRSAIDDWLLDTASAALALYLNNTLRNLPRLQGTIRAAAPLAVAAAFTIGVTLAIRPSLPPGLHSASVRAAAHNALQFVRDTRDAARQLRSSGAG